MPGPRYRNSVNDKCTNSYTEFDDIQTQERQYLHKRHMLGSGYRKWYTKIIKYGSEGHYPSYNNALKLRHGGFGQGVSVPWVAKMCNTIV